MLTVFARVHMIGKDQCVLTLLVLEVVEDALVLQQSRHEVEVAFHVLHTELPLHQRSLHVPLVVSESVITEHGIDDILGGLGLAAVSLLDGNVLNLVATRSRQYLDVCIVLL